MTEIEAQMMARLNKAASGQLGNLMGATGLNLPGINHHQTENKPGVMDKLIELKDKFSSKGKREGEADQQSPVSPTPAPASIGFGKNGHDTPDPS